MSVVLATERLRRELALRGLDQSDLARLVGYSPAAICHALAGRPVRERMLMRIASALAEAPVVPGVEALLKPPAPRLLAPEGTPLDQVGD